MEKFVAILTNAATDSINVIRMQYALILTVDTNARVRAVIQVTATRVKMVTNARLMKTMTAMSMPFAPTLLAVFRALVETGSTETVKRAPILTSAKETLAVTKLFASTSQADSNAFATADILETDLNVLKLTSAQLAVTCAR